MPANISSEQSGFIANFIYPPFKNIINITDFTFIVRKLAHFTQFMVLAIIFGLYYKYLIYKKYSIITITHITIVAIIDETIQIFIDGRAGLLSDVIIDIIGGIFGLLIVAIINRVFIKHNRIK